MPGAEKFGTAGAMRQPAWVFGKGSDWQAAPRARTKSSQRNPQLSERLLQSKRKGSAEAPRKMLEGTPPNPQTPSGAAQGTQGLRWELSASGGNLKCGTALASAAHILKLNCST